MTQKRLVPHWKEMVVFSAEGAQPQTLLETEKSKAVFVGLKAGQRIPPHPGGPAIFHFLEGSGRVTVGEDCFAVQPGATVVLPNGASRGVEAVTQLVFLAVRVP